MKATDVAPPPTVVLAGPAAGPQRLRSPSAGRATWVLVRRLVRRMRRTPESLMDVVVEPVLFLVLFVFLFGGAVAGSQRVYAQFVVPGVLVQSLLLSVVTVGVTLSLDVHGGVFDRFRSLPIARVAPLVAAVLAQLLRSLIAAAVTVGVGLWLGWRPEAGVLSSAAGLALLVAFAACVCWLPVFIALLVRDPSAVQGVLLPVMFPLTFASDAYVPADTVPAWLRVFLEVNPVSQAIGAARGLIDGGPIARPLLWTLCWMLALLAVLVPASSWAYRRQE